MRYIVIVLSVLLSGCAFFADPMTLIRTPSMSFTSMEDLQEYVTTELYYKAEFTDHWQAPQETIEKGTGDCEDFCILVGYFARKLGYEVYLVAIETPRGNHMIVTLNGVPYEGETMTVYPYYGRYEQIARLTLDEALRSCYIKYNSRAANE